MPKKKKKSKKRKRNQNSNDDNDDDISDNNSDSKKVVVGLDYDADECRHPTAVKKQKCELSSGDIIDAKTTDDDHHQHRGITIPLGGGEDVVVDGPDLDAQTVVLVQSIRSPNAALE